MGLVTERFDIRTEEEVTAFSTELYEKDMGLDLPRWRAFLFNDMADGQSMLCLSIDHTIGDGVSLTAVLMKCLDDMPNKPAVGSAKRKLEAPSYLARASAMLGGTASGLFGDLLPADQPNKLKVIDHRNPGLRKSFKQSPPIPVVKVKAVAAKLGGGTVNDVLFVVVSLTLRQYFQKYDEKTLGNNKVRANFPMDMRPASADLLDDKWFGNLVSQGQLQFPVHLDEPRAIFRHLKTQVDKIKYSPEPLIKEKVINAVAATSLLSPKTKQNLLLDAAGKVTAMFSNVPGPNAKVVFAGQELDDMAFTAFGPIGLYFGVVSYNGNFRAAICCDAECEPYPERLTNEWETAFDRVHQSVMRTPGHSRL